VHRAHSLVPALAVVSIVVTLLTNCAQVKPMKTLSGGQTGRIGFQTLTLTTKQFLTGVKEGNNRGRSCRNCFKHSEFFDKPNLCRDQQDSMPLVFCTM